MTIRSPPFHTHTHTHPPQRDVEDFLVPDPKLLLPQLSAATGPRFRALNSAMAGLLDEFSLVSFLPLDVTDEDRCVGRWVGGWGRVCLLGWGFLGGRGRRRFPNQGGGVNS